MSHDQGVPYVRSPRISSQASARNVATASQLLPRRPGTGEALFECPGNPSVLRERYNAEQSVGATLCPPGDDHTNALLHSLMGAPTAPVLQVAHSTHSLNPLEVTSSTGLLAAATSHTFEDLLAHVKPEAPLAIDPIGLQRPQLGALDVPLANASEAVPPCRPCWESSAFGALNTQRLYPRGNVLSKLPPTQDVVMPKTAMHLHILPSSPPELLTPGPLPNECPQLLSRGGQWPQLIRSESTEAEGGEGEGDGKPTSPRPTDGSRGRHDGELKYEHDEDESTDGDDTTYDRSARKRPAPRQRAGADRKELCRERNRTAQRRFRERQRDLIRALQEQVKRQSVIIQQLTNRVAKFEKAASN